MDHSDRPPAQHPQAPQYLQVTYGTARLQPFDVDAPTLTTSNGAVYLPIRWLCELLELAPSHWIGAVCAYFRDDHDSRDASAPLQRLPYQRPDGTWHAEWCLEWSRVVRWLTFYLRTWRLPQGPRRQQLEAYREEMVDRVAGLYDARQQAYRDAKREILQMLQGAAEFLKTLDDLDHHLGPHIEHSAHTPAEGHTNRAAFAAVVEEGRTRQHALAEALRAELQTLLDTPLIDGYEVNDEGVVINTTSMPVLPPTPDFRAIHQRMELANSWLAHDLPAWLRAHGFAATFTPIQHSDNRLPDQSDRSDDDDNE